MRQEEIILETENAKVRVIELQKNTVSPWHYHSELIDNCFCFVGEIKVHTKNPDRTVILKPGERHTIEANIVHCVENSTSIKAEFLLVQGTGKFDFIKGKL